MNIKLDQYEILCYKLTHLTQTQKVRFFYALKGRGTTQGILKQYNISSLSKGVLFVPEKSMAQAREFLGFWKCPFTSKIVYLEHEQPQKKA